MAKSILGVLGLAMLAVACAGAEVSNVADQQPADEVADVTDPALVAELDYKLNQYAAALLSKDHKEAGRLVSAEVLQRAVDMASDTQGLTEKLGGSLRRELALRGIDADADLTGIFAVERVVVEGEVLRVDASIDGTEVGKPFYFVMEDGEYKINVRRPGFSKPLPDGAQAGSDTYNFSNRTTNRVNFSCTGTSSFRVAPATCPTGFHLVTLDDGSCMRYDYELSQFDGTIHKVWRGVTPIERTTEASCSDNCGWFSGTTVVNGSNRKDCDYNSWGSDVIIDYSGWRCNDKC